MHELIGKKISICIEGSTPSVLLITSTTIPLLENLGILPVEHTGINTLEKTTKKDYFTITKIINESILPNLDSNWEALMVKQPIQALKIAYMGILKHLKKVCPEHIVNGGYWYYDPDINAISYIVKEDMHHCGLKLNSKADAETVKELYLQFSKYIMNFGK